jgi:hypothetical protein
MCLDNGIFLQDYLNDSSDFKGNSFMKNIHENPQLMKLCVTNVHHQNGVAEIAIQTISNMSRSMILHASMHWKDGIDASLWHQAVTYDNHVYNTTSKDGVCTTDTFIGSAVSRQRLMDMHVPDPKIQQGEKLPRWELQSKRGMFLGQSQKNASEVPLVLNLGTRSIITQFHVVFDDLFTTVPSIERESEPPGH